MAPRYVKRGIRNCYTREEFERLEHMRDVEKRSWDEIGADLGRKPSSCKLKYYALRKEPEILDDEGGSTLGFDWSEGGDLVAKLRGKGDGEERIEAEIGMPSFGGIGIAPSLILPTLESFDCETVRLFMIDAGEAVRVTSSEPGPITAVVMPKRM